MTMFFLDLWHDLREKRLWPVAVGLLAAIIAVPVLLFKPASDAAPPATVAPTTNGAATLPVVSVDSGPTVGSHLEAYKEKNPFKPMKDLAKTDGSTSGSGTASGDTSTGSGSTGTSVANPTGTGSSGGTGSGTSTGGTSPGGSSTPSTTTTTQTVKWFRYTADFSFGAPGQKANVFKDQASFTLLPDDKTPSIVFMGVNADHKHAMFFISDAGFQAQGEGKCNATGAACRFVTLSLADTRDEETFTAIDGSVSYDLKLLKINREALGSGKAPDAGTTPKSAKGIGATGAGVATATGTAQSVLPSMFADGPGVARIQG
jgi:hypothetical protein